MTCSEEVCGRLKLVVFHYHLRPGGIRRIIELGLPHILSGAPAPVSEVIVATGEEADPEWSGGLAQLCAPCPVRYFVDQSFGYISESSSSSVALRLRIRGTLAALLKGLHGGNCLVWAHNLAVGRNLILTRELAQACADLGLPLVAHHHDWWFDNRWPRWPEMRRNGFQTMRTVAETLFPAAPQVRHVAINQTDARILRKHLRPRATWLPNLTEPAPPPSPERIDAVRAWMNGMLADRPAPVWILPCRLLRRKNIAEALLLTRWLRPEGWLVTTGGASSSDEKPYAAALAEAARRHNWPLRLGVLNGGESGKPSVVELLAISEAVLLTSIQEGFGLPYLEAAAAKRPLIARWLPNIAPDLDQLGFSFPQSYGEIMVEPSLFDWPAEFLRQEQLFASWLKHLPRTNRRLVSEPALLALGDKPAALPFSKLTLSAQIEILAQPLESSWKKCAPLNPFLKSWRKAAQTGRLKTTQWPADANQWLSGPAYAARFWKAARAEFKNPLPNGSAVKAQYDFIRERLSAEHLFPLLWSINT
jgi:glycosyltransferase involved in cell wall biosynthesis